jgi:hypothetical protein
MNERDELALNLHATTDAKVWTDAYMERYGDQRPDRYVLLTWFANAIEAGRAAGCDGRCR